MGQPASNAGLSRRERLSGSRQFAAVFAAKMRKGEGPLAVFVAINHTGFPRLGLSIGRPVGGAVARNRFKRVIRDVFRGVKPRLPTVLGSSLDIVVAVRAHKELPAEEYRERLLRLAGDAAKDLERRERRKAVGPGGTRGNG